MEIKKLNKKGMFFTILAIALLSLFFVSYTIYTNVNDREPINKRIDTMNNFIFSLEEDLPRKLYASGFRIIFLFEEKIVENGTYIMDINQTFEEAFFNGTIYSEQQELMNGVRYQDIIDSINDKSNSFNVEVNLSNPKISISQEDPWNIKITLTVDLYIKDLGDLVSWNKTSNITTLIPIENFDDPLYIINTNGLIAQKVNKTIYEPFVDGSDVTNLTLHLNNGRYINSTSAPSFLNRLEGNITSNQYGVESLVYLPDLASQGITIKDKSIVDYIYFSDNDPSSNKVQSMPSWFKLDTSHHQIYGVENIIVP